MITLVCKGTSLRTAHCTVLPGPKLSCSPVALRRFMHTLRESCKQELLQSNITLLVPCTAFSLLDYSIFQ